MSTKTRFEEEAKGNSEMAYSELEFIQSLILVQVCICHARHALPRLAILDMSRRHMTRLDKAWFSYPTDLPAT